MEKEGFNLKMVDILGFLYIGYGLYYAGVKFPYGLDLDNKDDLTGTLILGVLVAVLWPVAYGVSKNKAIKNKENKDE